MKLFDDPLPAVRRGINCPALVVATDSDPLSARAQQLYEALPGPKALVRFRAEDGASGHCRTRNRSLFDQRVFDWLDATFTAVSARR